MEGPSVAIAAEPHPLTADDLPLLRGVSEPRLSPDGVHVAYVRTTTDYEANRSTSEIVVVPAEGGAAVAAFAGSSPRWSPDGTAIAFNGTRDEQTGIWVYGFLTGLFRFIASVHQSEHWTGSGTVKNLEWSPDGQWIAFVGAEGPPAEPTSDVRAFSRITFKTRTAFTDHRRTHLWVVSAAGGEPRLLTPGDHDEHSLAWSPDGKGIAFVSDRSLDPDNAYCCDLWTVDVETGDATRLTSSCGTAFLAQWSPDGRWLAYTARTRPWPTKDSSAEDQQLYLLPAGGGEPRVLTGALDRRVSSVVWHPDGRSVSFTAGDRGATGIYRVRIDTAEIEPIIRGEAQATQPSFDAAGTRLAYVQADVTHPAEVYVATADGTEPCPITREQDALRARVRFQPAETFWFESWDGAPVQGWVIPPAGAQDGERYPAILCIHGGPHGMYGWGFSDRFQWLAGRGYGVLLINPRGSTGYGQRFSDGTLNDWGGGDYRDLMAGVDAALRRYPWIDPERLGVTGNSYGGYMTNWVITQTARFQAAVAGASLSNLISFYGTSLYPDLIESEFNGMPWDNYPLLWERSPLAHVRNVSTPTLFLHGENDHDVPITQAEEMYVALRKRGVEAMLVRYSNEGHGIRRPRNVLDVNRRIDEWFDRYLKPEVSR